MEKKRVFAVLVVSLIIVLLAGSVYAAGFDDWMRKLFGIEVYPAPSELPDTFKITNPPADFYPNVGYYHGFEGGRIVLWMGEMGYVSSDGINFNKFDTYSMNREYGLPPHFAPDVGYYHEFSGGRVVLINSDGPLIEAYIWPDANGKFSGPYNLTDLGIPAGFLPDVGYYHPMFGGRVSLFDRLIAYIYSEEDGFFNGPYTLYAYGDFGKKALIPDIGYYMPFQVPGGSVFGTVALWQGENYYLWNKTTSSDFFGPFQVKDNIDGHIVNPTIGYYDKIRNKVVLWEGNKVYESDDGVNFKRVRIECSSNSDCGSNGYIGEPFCFVDVYQKYRNYTCTNPGTMDSECNYSDMYIKIDDCGGRGCVNGTCNPEQVDCYSDSDCPSSVGQYYCDDERQCRVVYSYKCENGKCVASGGGVRCKLCDYGCDEDTGLCILTEPSNETICTDSDGGLNYTTKGTAKGPNTAGQIETRTDYCMKDGVTLKETYCDTEGIIRTKAVNCTAQGYLGCQDRVCISESPTPPINQTNQTNQTRYCKDSDGGKNYYEAGCVKYYAPEPIDKEIVICDSCVDGIIKEVFCYEDNGASTGYKCPYGCFDGACLAQNPPVNCTPVYQCQIVPAKCPSSGKQNLICKDVKCGTGVNKETIECFPGKCTGCWLDNRCVAYGHRARIGTRIGKGFMFCDIDGDFKNQKPTLSECKYNYECVGNLCLNEKCIDIKTIPLRGRIRCFISRFFEDYNQCLKRYI